MHVLCTDTDGQGLSGLQDTLSCFNVLSYSFLQI